MCDELGLGDLSVTVRVHFGEAIVACCVEIFECDLAVAISVEGCEIHWAGACAALLRFCNAKTCGDCEGGEENACCRLVHDTCFLKSLCFAFVLFKRTRR